MAYVVSYFSFVQMRPISTDQSFVYYTAQYPVPDSLDKPVEFFFMPLHCLDKTIIRPNEWVMKSPLMLVPSIEPSVGKDLPIK